MGALWIAHVTVTDDEAYMKYAAIATVAIAEHGGEFIARAGRFVQLEGKERPRNVVAIAYIDNDELVEVTPNAIRMRKRYLDPHERKRASRAAS